MANKKIEFDLVFKANTTDAKKQMKELQTALGNIATGKSLNFSTGITQELKEATKAASELQVHLLKATNTSTQRLNLNEFHRSIAQSGTSLKAYAQQLAQLGPTGTASLMQLSQAIASAEKPMLRLNEAADKMWTTLKNTMRWQISTAALNAATGAISGAYDYAQRLNRSLNDIRIVTGRSTEEMARFAKQANRAAQVLSATTTEYTNASLIYYQQGLDDAEVAKRTEATIKLANVTRTSAETVSEWMTAIWNNFDNGSKSLEYYADVITALGAATASSSEEIATGLEKFAAVAESVGLSYEYATSALATITATTRQSADVVGTALKTLFARMQDLELGKTLDDGTTLGQYSANLEKIGVSVLDASGQLREMDTILNDLGQRWSSLSDAQKVATAQGVAGIRQYTQFMALMENWDFMQENLATATGASGALDAQADIYAESWEAAQKRVKASSEKLYDSLLNDEVFIKMTNTFAEFLDVLDPVLKGLGGIPGILGLVLSAIIKIKGQDMAQGLRQTANALFDITKKGQEAAKTYQQRDLKIIQREINDTADPLQADANRRKSEILESAMSREAVFSEEEKMRFANDLELQETLEKQNQIQKEKTDKAKEQLDAEKKIIEALKEQVELKEKLSQKKPTKEEKEKLDELSEITGVDQKKAQKALKSHEEILGQKQKTYDEEFKEMEAREADAKAHAEEMKKQYGKDVKNTRDWANAVVDAASAITTTTAIISSWTSAWDQLSDPNVSMWEKVVTVFSTLGTTIMMLIPTFNTLRGIVSKDTAITGLNTAAHFLNSLAKKKNAEATDNLGDEIKNNAQDVKQDTAKQVKDAIEERITGGGQRIRKTGKNIYQTFDNATGTWVKGTKGTAAAFKGAQATSAAAPAVTTGAGAGASGLGAAVTSFGSALLPFLPYIAAIAAVIAVIVALAARVKKHEEEYGEALKKANKEAEDRKQILSETREEYDNLKASLDQINEAQKDLDLMIRGSKEWKQSVAELNQQVTELLQKYPELAKHAKYVDGVLTISEEGQELLLDKQLKEVERASAASNLAQVNANRANAAYKADSLAQDSIKVDEWGAALLGLVGPGGPIENYFIAKEVEMNREDEMREAILRLSETYDPTKDFSSLVKDLGVSDSVEKALIKNRESVLELVNSNQALEAANKQLEIAIVKSNIEGDYTEGEKAIAAEVILQREKENQKGIEEARRNAETYRVNDAKWNKQQAEEWLRQKYGDKANQLEIRNFDGDSFTIWDKEAGNVLEGSKKNGFDYNDILKDLAQQRYLDEITGEGTVKEVAEQRRAYVSNLRGYFSGKGIKATDVEFESIADAILRGDKTADISGILNFADYETLKGNIGDLQAIDPEAYKVLNESLNEYVDQREDAAEQERQNYNGLVNINQEIVKTRELLGLTADEWLVYEDAVANALGVDDETFTDAFARITGNATAAITGLNKVWNEYNEVLSNPEPLSPEYSQALGKINEQMETWLGVDNLDLKPEFIEEHLDQIQEIAHGKLDRLPQLMSSISRQLVEQFDWPTKLKNQMNSVLAGINQEVYNYGDYISQSAADQLTTLLSKSSAAEAKQIEAILSARGFAVEEAMEEGKLNVSKLRYRGLGEYADLGALEDLQKELEAQIDRYHEIKEILDDINNALDEANKRKNKAFGAGNLAYLEQETVLLQRQSEALKQYQREAEGYLIQDKAALEAAGFGFKFDAQGRISNYREIMEGLAARTDSAGMAQAEELIKQYEESLNLAEDLNGQILDNHYALLDAKLEAVTTKVELKLDINERDKEYLDFLAGLTEDDRHVTIDLIGNYTSQRGLIESNIAANEAGLKGTYNLIMSGQGTKETVETMQGYYSDLLKEANNYRELGKQVIEAVKAEFESWNEDLDKAADGISHLTKVLEGLQNVIDVIGQENLGISDEVIGEMVKAQTEAANGALTASKETLEANRVALSEAETSLKIAQEELAKNPESRGAKDVVNYWQEAVDVAKKAVEEGELDVYEKWATALQAAADEFKWNTQQIADAFSEALGGIYGTIQDMSEAFGRQKELSELYLADYKKIYEVNKLNRKFNESIDTTSSVKAQRLLREAQEDLLAYQEAGVEMSKYDLEYKQKEYDLLVAQIALEEAQNAKSQVRLTKDSSGNWGYVYTADAAETEKAEQEYEDKLYAMQDFMAKSEEELSEYYIEALNEYYDTVQKLAEKYGEGSEKYLKGVEEAQKVLSTKTSYYLGELEGLTTRAEQLNSRFAANCVATFRDTILGGMYSEYDNFKELQNGVTLALEESVNGLTGAYGDLQTKISNVCSLAGVDIEEFSKLATEKTNTVVNKTKELVSEVGDIAEAYRIAFKEVLNQAKAFYEDEGGYEDWIDKYIDKITEWTDAMDAAMAKQAKLDKQQADAKLRETASEKFASSNFGTLLDNRATGAPDSVYNQVAKKIFENADAKGILWDYGKDGETQQLTNKGAQIAQGAANSWKTAATSAAASSINTAMGSSTSIGSSGSKSFNTAMTAGSSAINNLGIEDYLNNTYNIGSKISGAVSSRSNKVPEVSGNGSLTYNNVQKMRTSFFTQNGTVQSDPENSYTGFNSQGHKVYIDLSKLSSNDYTLKNGQLTLLTKNSSGVVTEYADASSTPKILDIKLGAKKDWKNYRKMIKLSDGKWYGKWDLLEFHTEEDDQNDATFNKEVGKYLNGGEWYYATQNKGENESDLDLQDIPKTAQDNNYVLGSTVIMDHGDPVCYTADANAYGGVISGGGSSSNIAHYNKGTELKITRLARISWGGKTYWAIQDGNAPKGDQGKWFLHNPNAGWAAATTAFDTGGYTGEWGPSGKMAMLHEKEIVLNKYDTANLLSAIDLVRQFESSLASMKWGLGALTAVNQLHHNYSDTLEQNVTIHAEFPNATDHREIEEAFGNLVNLASQYAQRK